MLATRTCTAGRGQHCNDSSSTGFDVFSTIFEYGLDPIRKAVPSMKYRWIDGRRNAIAFESSRVEYVPKFMLNYIENSCSTVIEMSTAAGRTVHVTTLPTTCSKLWCVRFASAIDTLHCIDCEQVRMSPWIRSGLWLEHFYKEGTCEGMFWSLETV